MLATLEWSRSLFFFQLPDDSFVIHKRTFLWFCKQNCNKCEIQITLVRVRTFKYSTEFYCSSSGSSNSGSGSGSASDSDKSSPEKSSEPTPTKSSPSKSRQSASDLKQVKKSASSATKHKTEVGGNIKVICDALCYFPFCGDGVHFQNQMWIIFLFYIQHINIRCDVRIISVIVVWKL